MSGGGQFDYGDGYVDVATRIAQFREVYPEGSLQPANPQQPFEIIYLDDQRSEAWLAQYGSTTWARYQPTAFVAYTAAAFRSPTDPRPGIGVAWEPFPGLTPYTHNSELMNAETSAWGRAIVAVLAADARASREEFANRRSEQNQADEGVGVPMAKGQLVRASSREVAVAVWDMLKLPSGRNTRVTQEQLDAAVALAETIASGADPFLTPDGDAPLPGDVSEGDSDSGGAAAGGDADGAVSAADDDPIGPVTAADGTDG